MKPDVLVFDMDGVLVDVHASYRECIVASVHKLTGKTVTHEQIQAYKNRGGFNNDWLLTQTIATDLGFPVEYPEAVRIFNELFFNTYMARETWIPEGGLIARLASRYPLYIFTGRLNEEAQITLKRFEVDSYFAAVFGDDNVARPKPDPDGLLKVQNLHPGSELLYLGDNIDDRRAAELAQVPFLGVGTFSGASIVIENVNQLEALLA